MDRAKQLETFVKHVELLRPLPLVAKGQGVGWSLNVSKAKGMSVQVNLLDENDLRSFLLTFRMFISPKADVQLNKVYDTCFLKLKANNDLRDRLVEAREVWKEALGKAGRGANVLARASGAPVDERRLFPQRSREVRRA